MKTILISILLTSCSFFESKSRFDSITSWGYQLQNYVKEFNTDRIKDSQKRLWVIDYSNGVKRYTSEEINKLKKNKNVIVSYLSVGEAEKYRFYWKKLPKDLLIKKNEYWGENYTIKYWSPIWQEAIFEYLDQILEADFDGIYLDIVDAFWAQKNKKLAAKQMVTFISKLRERAHKKNPNFLVIQQNASSIFYYIEDKESYFQNIDAIAIESIFFHGNEHMNNKYNPQTYVLNDIKEYQQRKKKVFNIEYIDQKDKIKRYKKEFKKLEIFPLTGHRDLNGPLKFYQR